MSSLKDSRTDYNKKKVILQYLVIKTKFYSHRTKNCFFF